MTETPEGRGADPAELGLREGMTVEVLTKENFVAFVGKVVSIQDCTVTLRDSRENDLPQVTFNQEMKLRFLQNGETTMVQGKICGSNVEVWKLDRLVTMFTKENRASFRQGISTSIQAKCRPQGAAEKENAPCQVLDVSAGGLMFSSKEKYEVGQRLTLTGIRLVERMDPFKFNCQVRRAGTPEEGVVRYGCQFEPLTPKEEDRLLQAIFAVQREEIRLQKAKSRV